MAWIESSGPISADHPPLGLSPNNGAASMRVMRKGGNPALRDDDMAALTLRWILYDDALTTGKEAALGVRNQEPDPLRHRSRRLGTACRVPARAAFTQHVGLG